MGGGGGFNEEIYDGIEWKVGVGMGVVVLGRLIIVVMGLGWICRK